ncbi:hypothetical protein AR457_01835 [Streptomyces agglomeratus]|nr:hypothetical protein AR457_01835 [Streptomyces agglomeratus]
MPPPTPDSPAVPPGVEPPGTDGSDTEAPDTDVPGTEDRAPDGDEESGALPIVLVLLGTAMVTTAAVVGVRHRGPRWVHRHVHAVLRSGPGLDSVRQIRDSDTPDRTVRLEPRRDPGQQIIQEEDDQ